MGAARSGFGDPTVSWSILLHADLASQPDPASVRRGLDEVCARFPHLGPTPDVAEAESLDDLRHQFAETLYLPDDPLVRAAVGPQELLIAAHHGACDGLGLLALLGAALDIPVASGAVGVADRPAEESFLRSAARRVTEALLHPPARVEPSGRGQRPGELLLTRHEPRIRAGTSKITAAAARAVTAWNERHDAGTARLVAAVGVSRRGGDDIAPRDESAFLRLPLESTDREQIGRALAEQAPEPRFPDSPGLLTTLGTRLLGNRLGSSFLVSNLGPVSTSDLVRRLAFRPAASGRSAVAFGAVTVADTTTITMRARARDFDTEAAGTLLADLVNELRGD
ncbi:hypothetical protein [Actinokineospora xionganensis]|uniref:Condensation domain-containing protein n=1 Tax=Actinokineospora xionganensis TaxID=2684470 RepID=A0ABR7L3X8_9PSEU|nr:hypothetical protein [Actinokineospora xionganensis]MBC6447282.1 hypothetical protein [Actinokineospora xionganensis]